MIKFLIIWILIFSVIIPTSALEISPPEVPSGAMARMPKETGSFIDGLWEVIQIAFKSILPDFRQTSQTAISVICVVMLLTLIYPIQGNTKQLTEITGSIVITLILLSGAHSMIDLASNTIQDLSDYGKLLCPVMTAAMAAQGSISTAAALYAGTAFFDSILCRIIAGLLVPMVYLVLVLALVQCAFEESLLKRFCDTIKKSTSWLLKIILTVFTTFMGISGVISGNADALALKATKITISSVVPIIGSTLSDASEAVLLSAGMAKNAAGIYGVFAILAVFLTPFLQISCHYIVLKITAAVCCIIGPGKVSSLIEEYSAAMGLLLGMIGSVCLIQLISTVCFLKGVG